MLWNWNTIDACFLAESWQIKNNGMMAASCIGIVLLVTALEGLRRIGRDYDAMLSSQANRRVRRLTSETVSSKPVGDAACCAIQPAPPRTVVLRASFVQQLVRAIIYAVTFGVAYIVMLCAMYFNGYIIISIVIGAGLGKFLCDWMVVKVVVREEGGTGSTLGSI